MNVGVYGILINQPVQTVCEDILNKTVKPTDGLFAVIQHTPNSVIQRLFIGLKTLLQWNYTVTNITIYEFKLLKTKSVYFEKSCWLIRYQV